MDPSALDLLVCSTCGVQYDATSGLKSCKICDDPRQYVPPSGQSWTTLRSLQASPVEYRNVFTADPENPNLISIQTVPKFAIGQRAFLCLDRNGSGNVLWDCITYLDDETIRHINSLGGIRAIVISHPHYFSTSIQWADAFNCDLYISAEDEEWVANRGDGHRLKLWQGKRLSLPSHAQGSAQPKDETSDFVAIKTGGHFPGSSVLWWKSARKLLIADTIMIVPSGLYRVDRPAGTVSYAFMWSYPNYIPLPPDDVHGIWKAIEDIDFEDTHGAFTGQDARGNNVKRRYGDVCVVEDSKDKIIMDLFAYIEDLTKELRDGRDEVDNHKRLIASFKEENRNLENMLEDMRRAQAKLSFVSVLVDGDGMNFHGNLVKDGKHGGLEAARLLTQAVQDHIQKVDPEAPPNISCKIRVFANVEGLTGAYRNNNILSAGESLTSFIQGFNQENALCDFVDAGNGKECADVKLRARFEQDIIDVHCRRIIFCASADNSHARVLSAHRGSKRISLVKGPPFAQEMEELAAGFKTDSFENVFMSSKLKTTRRVSFSATNTAITPPRTPTPNYASAAKAAPPTQSSSLVVSAPAHGASKLRPSVCVNSRGQRVDHPLRYSSKENVETLKRRKLCNKFHLLESCPYGNNCTHKHGPSLSATEITDLTHIARSSVCPNGIFCHDVTCVCGHRCPQKDCSGRGCKFPDSMHGVDTDIVKTI
ncbi:hypothetical protein CNMCM5878_001420 [Aspergillus fumigatiaffinis]|nr:hypothetical protein CNMCM5878_001420 [Aspergillus fumigatiaffinis]